MLKTLTRSFKGPEQVRAAGELEILLSGIVHVTSRKKPNCPKFVEVRYDSGTNSTILMVYRTRDTKRTEAMISLQAASIIINYDQPNGIAVVTREKATYGLEIDPEREDLTKTVAQWRSVMKESRDPSVLFSVISVGGNDRGSVILVAFNHPDFITLKFMSGVQGQSRDAECTLKKILSATRVSAYEICVETAESGALHFISKRASQLVSMFESRMGVRESVFSTTQVNDTETYASRTGYMKRAGQGSSEVESTAADYLPFAPRAEQGIFEEEYLAMASGAQLLSPDNADDLYMAMDEGTASQPSGGTDGSDEDGIYMDEDDIYMDPSLKSIIMPHLSSPTPPPPSAPLPSLPPGLPPPGLTAPNLPPRKLASERTPPPPRSNDISPSSGVLSPRIKDTNRIPERAALSPNYSIPSRANTSPQLARRQCASPRADAKVRPKSIHETTTPAAAPLLPPRPENKLKSPTLPHRPTRPALPPRK